MGAYRSNESAGQERGHYWDIYVFYVFDLNATAIDLLAVLTRALWNPPEGPRPQRCNQRSEGKWLFPPSFSVICVTGCMMGDFECPLAGTVSTGGYFIARSKSSTSSDDSRCVRVCVCVLNSCPHLSRKEVWQTCLWLHLTKGPSASLALQSFFPPSGTVLHSTAQYCIAQPCTAQHSPVLRVRVRVEVLYKVGSLISHFDLFCPPGVDPLPTQVNNTC